MRSRFSATSACGLVILLLALYVSPYLYYRFVRPDFVLHYRGSKVGRPPLWRSFLGDPEHDYTLDPQVRTLGFLPPWKGYMNGRENIASLLEKKTKCDCTGAADTLFYPLARVDHLVSGNYISFRRTYFRLAVPAPMAHPVSPYESAIFDPPQIPSKP